MSRRSFLAASAGLLAAPMVSHAQQRLVPTINAPSLHINKLAPEFDVAKWIQGGPLSMAGMRGSVVAIDFFQLWCPMCNSFTGPVFNYWLDQRFPNEVRSGRLKLVGVHTVFEGFEVQTEARLRSYLVEKSKRFPIANDRKDLSWVLPATMEAWGNRATPTVAIVDRHGIVRFHQAGRFDVGQIDSLIEGLLG